MAEALTLNAIRELLSKRQIAGNEFEILKGLCSYVANPSTSYRATDTVLRALEHRDQFGASAPILDGLVRQVGLFPYLNPETLGFTDAIAYELHRPENMEDDGIVFHAMQAQAYGHLMDGENVILSAPTSFGKSLIIDAVIASGNYKTRLYT